MKNEKGEMLVGGAVIFKEGKGKNFFMLTKNNDGEFEILKSTVRRGESSVRSVIRYTSEQGNMNTRVLDEVGRATGTGMLNNKPVTFKYIYYLLLFKAGIEISGVGDISWYDYATASKKIKLKREKDMIKTANSMIKEWEKKKKKK
ncbi:MAG: hypothetical protein ACD_19C00182G0001 [uncultured bacterium]|nr:MAG: hypothetical protein ACD_19C00182G0001 [uncultured bacterium]